MAAKRAAERKSRPRVELAAPSAEVYAAAHGLAAQAALPARVGNVRFGTAGWSDASLSRAELFYPKAVKSPETRLRFYAEHFALVEVDATYYALLAADTVRRWAEWTPDTFQFDVKAHPVFTGHPIDRQRLPAELALSMPEPDGARVYPSQLSGELAREIESRYFMSLAPLIELGRLSSILLQFPPWFEATRGSVRHLEGLRARHPDAPFSVEFRHRSWLLPERRERVLDLLRAQNFCYVVVDEPDVDRGGVPPLALVASPRLAILRFHGQNRQAWATPRATVAERFNYLYAPAELRSWTERVRRLSGEAEQVHAVFNNCVRNFAILNAKGLSALLATEPG
ncbi:MAG TPA: DUF72 domain-containing protein [Polyangiaceae bacterium]|jgi:uncharacterized protein YecE (DUF72 family)|nr:DUF72 domain-containing protein [Polyangiaceae bacterium]